MLSYLTLFLLFFRIKWCFGDTICVVQGQRSYYSNNSIDCQGTISVDDLIPEGRLGGSNDIELIFFLPDYTLRDKITFTNVSDITLTGSFRTITSLTCNAGAGVIFTNVDTVTIHNINFIECGANANGGMRIAVGILICNYVAISNMTVTNGIGIGLYLKNISNGIDMSSSKFLNDHEVIPDSVSYYISKVYLDISDVNGTKYSFFDCVFQNAHNQDCNLPTIATFNKEHSFRELKSGGGIFIYLGDNASNVNLMIVSCHFENNLALNGGGLSLNIQDFTQNNCIKITDSVFKENCAYGSGGGVYVSFAQEKMNVKSNNITFVNNNFTYNSAIHGGGVFLSVSSLDPNSCKTNNYVTCDKCRYIQNKAILGSAVNIKSNSYIISNNILLEPLFSNCVFEDNIIRFAPQEITGSRASVKVFGKGSLYSNEVNIQFQGEVMFTGNNGSAVFLVSSILKINNSNTTFRSNTGYYGGGVTMLRNSVIHLEDNAYVLFDSNKAIQYGGALFHETYNDPYETGNHRCFIRYIGRNREKRLFQVKFDNNGLKEKARNNSESSIGLSIFLYSLTPCVDSNNNETEALEVLKSIANILILDYLDKSDVSTLPSNFSNVSNLPTQFIPGKETDLKIVMEDDLHTVVPHATFTASISWASGDIDIDRAYDFVSNNIIKLTGTPSSSGILEILVSNKPDYQLLVPVSLLDCPPGYVLSNTKICECSANVDKQSFIGIKRCNLSSFEAHLVQGYWAGYVNSTSENFRTSNCPLNFCKVKSGTPEIKLPSDRSKLDTVLCNENRHGKVCSLCSDNHSLHYHTLQNAHCGDNSKCSLGILLYLILEIIPVTIFFLFIILLDVQLTSGALSGFLFYAQIFNTLEINAGNFIHFPKYAKTLLIILKFLIGVFNLEFFQLPSLSFCLVKGATYMHLLVFSYLTIFYALMLIIVTVLVVNSRLGKVFVKMTGSKRYKNRSIIHGLSSFLVICFSRSSKTSLQILNPVTLFGKNGKAEERVAYYHGEYTFFGREHTPFAILAIAALLLTSLPVVLLLVYPACHHCMAFLRLGESKFHKCLCQVFPMDKLKPFFDSFQSTFKDNHRYYAGLFFVYRFMSLLINNITNSHTKFYFALEVQFILALAFHGWIQPHKIHWHNHIDIFIMALLTILNGITNYNFHSSLNLQGESASVLITLQIVLAYLPLLYVTLLGSFMVKQNIRKRWPKNHGKKDNHLFEKKASDEILEMLDQDEQDLMSSYQHSI